MARPRDDLLAQVEPGRFSPDYAAERWNRGSADVLARHAAASGVRPARIVQPKLSAPDANYLKDGPAPFVCGNCRYIVWGTSRPGSDPKEPDPDDVYDLCQVVEGPFPEGAVRPGDTCRLFLPKPSYAGSRAYQEEPDEDASPVDDGQDADVASPPET